MIANYFIDSVVSNAVDELATVVYEMVCRHDFAAPGFALIRQSRVHDSLTHRRELVALKNSLSNIHQSKAASGLGWFTMSRFDQKNTTKLHRDGGPDESILILGYEPTEVHSEVSIADYSACAHELGLTPNEFLEEFNPMYEVGAERLAPYTSIVEKFDRTAYQMLIINNSASPFSSIGAAWQGVLHGARMVHYENHQSRIINSTSVVPQAMESAEAVSSERQTEFINDNDLAASTYS